MSGLITHSFLLAILQAMIPIHWLPLVALERSEKWTRTQMVNTTCIAASAHVLGTAVLGALIGITGLGYESYVHWLAPTLLIAFGSGYYFINRTRDADQYNFARRPTRTWIGMFVLLMFFSPCLEAKDLVQDAALFGTNIILLSAMIYAVMSVAATLLLVYLFTKISHRIRSPFLNEFATLVTAGLLIIVGIISFYIH